MKKIITLTFICCLYLNGPTNACGQNDNKPSIDKPGYVAGQDVSQMNLPPPGQCGCNETCKGYAACYQITVYYQEGIRFCKNTKLNKAATPAKWIFNARAIFSYAETVQKYYNENIELIKKNNNHVIMLAISKLSVIYCQWVLYALVQIFKASLKVIDVDTMVQGFTSVLTWLQYGYSTISNFIKINYLQELVGYAVQLSYTFGKKYYDYSSKSSTAVSATVLFSETIDILQKMNHVWYTYVRALQGLTPTFSEVVQRLINVIEILYNVLFRYILQYKDFVGSSTQDFYKATTYLNEVRAILDANPTLLDNPKLYKSVYCFLENQEAYALIIYIGHLVDSFETTTSTFLFKEAYIGMKETANDVNKYCTKCQR